MDIIIGELLLKINKARDEGRKDDADVMSKAMHTILDLREQLSTIYNIANALLEEK